MMDKYSLIMTNSNNHTNSQSLSQLLYHHLLMTQFFIYFLNIIFNISTLSFHNFQINVITFLKLIFSFATLNKMVFLT